jgi:hypothetical protein
MRTLDQKLQDLLSTVNAILSVREKSRPAREVVRRRLQDEVGAIKREAPLAPDTIGELAGGRPLVGVDGSVTAYGALFPQIIHFFRALASTTALPVEEGLCLVDLFYPELEAHRREIEETVVRAAAAGENLALEAAASQLVRARLAALEVRAAREAVEKYQPFAVLFDGGFLRYGSLAPAEWKEYRELAVDRGVVSIGVIEEIGTFDLARKILAEPVVTPSFTCDRDLLFGVLEPGEWLEVKGDLELKKTYYTCFARPGSYPGAVAYDFFQEQAHRAAEFIPLLFGLTPRGGRGIPWWLDQVDAAVRITRLEMELLLDTCLDRGFRERLFVPRREKRTL